MSDSYDKNDFGKILPFQRSGVESLEGVLYDSGLEMDVLGYCMMFREKFDQIAQIAKEEHFFIPVHAAVWRAICAEMARSGTLPDAAECMKTIERDLLASKSFASPQDFMQWYIGIVKNFRVKPLSEDLIVRQTARLVGYWRKRQLVNLAAMLNEDARDRNYSDGRDLTKAADAQIQLILNARGELPANQPATKLDEAMANNRRNGVTYGLACLDRALGGAHRKEVTIVGAATNVGKSFMACHVARNAAYVEWLAKGGNRVMCKTVVVFSLEMSEGDFRLRMVAAESGVPMNEIADANERNDPVELERLVAARALNLALPISVYDEEYDVADIVNLVREEQRKNGGVLAVVIDHFQRIKRPNRSGARSFEELSTIAHALQKKLAQKLNVPVVLMAQLNRKPLAERRPPQTSDIRECGDAENAADIVVLIDWPADRVAYPDQAPGEDATTFQGRINDWIDARDKPERTLIVAKNRRGKKATFKVGFYGSTGIFLDADDGATT